MPHGFKVFKITSQELQAAVATDSTQDLMGRVAEDKYDAVWITYAERNANLQLTYVERTIAQKAHFQLAYRVAGAPQGSNAAHTTEENTQLFFLDEEDGVERAIQALMLRGAGDTPQTAYYAEDSTREHVVLEEQTEEDCPTATCHDLPQARKTDSTVMTHPAATGDGIFIERKPIPLMVYNARGEDIPRARYSLYGNGMYSEPVFL